MAEQRCLAVPAVIADGHDVAAAAQQWDVSRQALHTWIARYEADGLPGLEDRSHRPRACLHRMDPLVEAAVLELRRLHPAWAPRRIVVEPAQRGVAPLPSESGVYRALTRVGVIEPRPPAATAGIVEALGARCRDGVAVPRWSCSRWRS